MNALAFVAVAATAVVLVNGQQQLTCPLCADGYDITSCTGTQECTPTQYMCQLFVDRSDNNRVEYSCESSQTCATRESAGCVIVNGAQHCFHCCADVDACNAQRVNLFATTYVANETATPNATTTSP